VSKDTGESKVRIPAEGELLGKVVDIVGDDRVKVLCQDGKVRLARIPGRYRKKVWFKIGDYVLVVPWDFEPNKADLVYKYEKGEVNELRMSGYGEILNRLDELSI